MRILLVEDDPTLARSIQVLLEVEDYEVTWANSLEKAMKLNSEEPFHLTLLDLGLGRESGFDFLSHVRGGGSRMPVIILTAQTDEDSVVKGLELGANDYVKKPFGNRELIARIRAALREPSRREDQIRYDDLVLILNKRTAHWQDLQIELNRREFDILAHFIERSESVVTRQNILDLIDHDGEIFDRTIDSHVSHIRKKLKSAGITAIKISSVYGLGYRLEKHDPK